MSIEDTIYMEYDVMMHYMEQKPKNFDIGVNHLLYKKLKTRPPWEPASIYEISKDEVLEAFDNKTGKTMRNENI